MPKATTEAARLERERIIGSRREELHEETHRFFQSLEPQSQKARAAVVNCEKANGKGSRPTGLRGSSSRG